MRGIDAHFDAGQAAGRHRPVVRLIGVLEVAVANQLGVDAAVRGAVDVLEEDAVEHRADGVARLVHVDGQRGRRRPQGSSGGEDQGGDD